MIAVKTKSQLRAQKSNVVLAILALTDFLVGILAQPIFIAGIISILLQESNGLSCVTQILSFAIANSLFTSSLLHLVIARNSGHFAPVINCQRNLISKMADKNDRSQGKRIPCDFFNNLSSVDLFYEEKSGNETPCKEMLGLYSAERLIATKQYAAVPFVTFS